MNIHGFVGDPLARKIEQINEEAHNVKTDIDVDC